MGAVVSDLTERTRSQLRLAAQYQVTRVLSAATSFDEAAEELLAALCENLDWTAGRIWTAEHGDVLELRNMYRPAGVEDGDLGDGGLAGRALKSGRAEWATDLPGSDAGLKSGLAFPILVGSTVCGVVELQSTERRERDEDLLAMSSALGSQIGQFIERTRAEEASRTRTRRLAFLAEASRVLSSSLDFDATLRGSPSWRCRRSQTGAASPHSTTTAS